MVFACGIDIEERDRFNKHYFSKGKLSDLMYDIFTSKEIENFSIYGREAFLKGFSFKEAFFKASNEQNIGFKDVEIIFCSDLYFEVYPSKNLKRWMHEQNIIQIKADFQNTDKYVVFKVLLIK